MHCRRLASSTRQKMLMSLPCGSYRYSYRYLILFRVASESLQQVPFQLGNLKHNAFYICFQTSVKGTFRPDKIGSGVYINMGQPWFTTYLSMGFYVTDGNIMYLTDASRFLISCVIQHYAPVVGWRNRCIMLIMSLYPSWKHTLRLTPPGIEPGSPASQAGTLPKELSRHLIPMLQIRDFYPRSRILIFSHPGSWIQNRNKREG